MQVHRPTSASVCHTQGCTPFFQSATALKPSTLGDANIATPRWITGPRMLPTTPDNRFIMQPPYIPQFDYTVDEFVGHFDHFVRSPDGTEREALIRYFGTRYPNRSEAL